MHQSSPKSDKLDRQLAAFLSTFRPQINDCLSKIFQQQTAEASQLGDAYGELLGELTLLVGRGGKRLRPLLCILAYQGFGGADEAAILKIAAAQELLHAFLLIHDDIIDRDQYRWGGLNITGRYFENLSQDLEPREALHYAQSHALLAGDICFIMAQETVQQSGFTTTQTQRALLLLRQIVLETLGGETQDVAFALREWDIDSDELLDMYKHKTAAYTFKLPLQTGALLAGAKPAALQKIADCGEDLGIAFQLQDDLLGVFGDEAVTGKPNLSDLREGKRTLLMSKGLALASKSERKTLLGALGNPDVTAADLKTVRTILVKTGARAYAESLIEQHMQAALMASQECGFNAAAEQLLRSLFATLLRRTA